MNLRLTFLLGKEGRIDLVNALSLNRTHHYLILILRYVNG